MALACISTSILWHQHQASLIHYPALVVPAAYHGVKRTNDPGAENIVTVPHSLIPDRDKNAQNGLNLISHGTAILLLGVYIGYLIFQLKTHPELFVSKRKEIDALADAGAGESTDIEEEVLRMSVEAPRMSVIAGSVGYVPYKNNRNIRS